MAISPEIAKSDQTSKMAWNVKPLVETANLLDVMSEQLAVNLQHQEDSLVGYHEEERSKLPHPEENAVSNTENDFMVAQLLQLQFDKEYDEILDKTERKYNGDSKVSVSYSNFRTVPRGSVWEDVSSSEEEIDDENRSWDVFEDNEKDSPNISKCGYSKSENGIITKHDLVTTNRRNACRIMELPPGIETGDGGGFDMQLNNRSYNALRVHASQEQKRKMRIMDKTSKSTAEIAMDPKTRLIIHKMIDHGMLESVTGSISTGKEAVVLHAIGGQSEDQEIPSHCAIKVFKTTLNEFKNRDRYIQDDIRFKDRFSKLNPRKIIHLWAEKEKRNLTRLAQAKIPCPEVVTLKKHVLVMSFIGEQQYPAPKLKDVHLSSNQWQSVFGKVISYVKTMYDYCQLVHADLSEYNLLWHNEEVFVIDVSQSVELHHPHALEFLYRDCNNVITFFRKCMKVDRTTEQLFSEVCGLALEGEGNMIDKIREYEKTVTKSKRINRVADYPSECDYDNANHNENFDCLWEEVAK